MMFSEVVTSHQNGAAENSIKTLVTMTRTMFMNSVLRCPKKTFSTDLWTIIMEYYVCVYNIIPDIKSGIPDIEILSISRSDTVS